MDSAPWPQGIGVVQQPMESTRPVVEKKPRPQKEQALNCPRCNSTNTKFCYYNNYSLSQPRYFCKTCRRYWTEGGSMRNVPVGGGSRKNKRSISTSSSLPATPSMKIPDLTAQSFPQSVSSHHNPNINVDGQDLNVAYPPLSAAYCGSSISEFVELPYNENKTLHQNPNSSSHIPSAMELLKPGIASRRLSSFMSMPISDTTYSAGFPLQDFKPSFKFSPDGFENAEYGNLQDVQETGPRLFFPFENLKSVSSTSTELQQNREQGESNGHWNGMLGGGTW